MAKCARLCSWIVNRLVLKCWSQLGSIQCMLAHRFFGTVNGFDSAGQEHRSSPMTSFINRLIHILE